MLGIRETCVAGWPVASEDRLKPRRVKPKRSWLTDAGVTFQLCSPTTLSARVSVLPMKVAVNVPLPSGSGVAGSESSRKYEYRPKILWREPK